jgi:hypothetical protein
VFTVFDLLFSLICWLLVRVFVILIFAVYSLSQV